MSDQKGAVNELEVSTTGVAVESFVPPFDWDALKTAEELDEEWLAKERGGNTPFPSPAGAQKAQFPHPSSFTLPGEVPEESRKCLENAAALPDLVGPNGERFVGGKILSKDGEVIYPPVM